MSVITQPGQLDTREIAKKIKGWLDGKGFETKALEAEGAYIVKARKGSALRAAIGADRAIEIDVRHLSGETQVVASGYRWCKPPNFRLVSCCPKGLGGFYS